MRAPKVVFAAALGSAVDPVLNLGVRWARATGNFRAHRGLNTHFRGQAIKQSALSLEERNTSHTRSRLSDRPFCSRPQRSMARSWQVLVIRPRAAVRDALLAFFATARTPRGAEEPEELEPDQPPQPTPF